MYARLPLRVLSVVFAAVFLVFVGAQQAGAAYSVGFKTDSIKITTPTVNRTECDRSLTIEGTSTLDTVWFCVRGEGEEVTTYGVPVTNGKFSKTIWLRFGSGKYTIWAGDNGKKFDGKIRFEVINKSVSDYFALTPSHYVNSDDPKVQKLAATLIKEEMSELDKVKAIYGWVTKNIAYDAEAYCTGNVALHQASEIIASQKGTCGDYAFLYAALARAVGLETHVLMGDVWSTTQQAYERHAWNETKVDGKWICLDSTMDAGYVKNMQFVASPDTKYLNMDRKAFNEGRKAVATSNY